jgi:hypothetical protein
MGHKGRQFSWSKIDKFEFVVTRMAMNLAHILSVAHQDERRRLADIV